MQQTQQYAFQYVNAEGNVVNTNAMDQLAFVLYILVSICFVVKIFTK